MWGEAQGAKPSLHTTSNQWRGSRTRINCNCCSSSSRTMGVPKFFRWISERYPLINQPINCPPKEETKKSHGFPSRNGNTEDADPDNQGSGSYGRKNTK